MMAKDLHSDFTRILRSLMTEAGITSYRQLSDCAQVSTWQIQQIRSGKLETMRLASLLRLSQCFNISISELIQCFSPPSKCETQTFMRLSQASDGSDRAFESIRIDGDNTKSNDINPPSHLPSHRSETDRMLKSLQAEYDRLQKNVEAEKMMAVEDFLREALEILESWMLQWPTVVHAIGKNDTLPASKLIPLVRPVERLLERWGIEVIATVGEVIPYDPSCQQLISGTAQSGDLVRVRYVGYRCEEKLLHRVKVSPA